MSVEKQAELHKQHSDKESQNTWTYDPFIWFFDIIFQVFFRTIQVRGAWRIPREGPVILVGAPHANQFVDPVLLGIQVRKMANRRVSFLIAEKSYKHPIIGRMARMMRAIPVGRTQDNFRAATGEVYSEGGDDAMILCGQDTRFTIEAAPGKNISFDGYNDIAPIKTVISDTELVLAKPFKTERCIAMMADGFKPLGFKIGEKIDNTQMFHRVFEHLAGGHSLGIFPEGGSHDRSEMLPLKPGVAIMALGATAYCPGLKVAVVPVGMNYFHPHKFRSRAVIEFGAPLYVDEKLAHEYIEGGAEGKKESVAKFMSRIVDALQLVTINCPDYETLLVVQAGQRLYKSQRQIPLSLTIEFTRRFVQGFLEYKEKDPRIKRLFDDVKSYNNQLRTMGISDHQVPHSVIKKRYVFLRLIRHIVYLFVLSALSLPGLILGSPILIATKLYSNRKAKLALAASSVKIQANDVVATWKILVSLLLVPCVFGLYAIGAYYYAVNKLHLVEPTFDNMVIVYLLFFWGLHLFGYATIIIGEAGIDMARSIKPLYLALSPTHKDSLKQLRETREELRIKITDIVNELGPELFPDIADRLEKAEKPNLLKDPRIDLRALNSSLNLKGDYDLAKVPVFSSESAPITLRRRRNKADSA